MAQHVNQQNRYHYIVNFTKNYLKVAYSLPLKYPSEELFNHTNILYVDTLGKF